MCHKILIVSAIFLLTACEHKDADKKQAAQIPQVNVVTLKTEPVIITTSLPGRTASVREAEVRPQVSGIIQKRLFVEGSEVKAGQPLYQIDPATYQAAYNKAQANLNNANSVAKRYQPLMAMKAISAQEYENAVSSQKQAAADLQTAKINLDYTVITAPISGRISRSLVTEGALVTNGQSSYLTTIQQLDPIYVDISASSMDRLRERRLLESGQLVLASKNAAKVNLTLEDGSRYSHPGKLEFSEVIVDEGTGSIVMRAEFPNPNNELLPGMFVHAELEQGINRNGILVPQEAVSRDTKSRPFVYVLKQDGTVEQRNIETGEMIKDQWLVTNGLKAGEKIVTNGLQNIRAGAKVNATERPEKTDSTPRENLSMTDPSAQ